MGKRWVQNALGGVVAVVTCIYLGVAGLPRGVAEGSGTAAAEDGTLGVKAPSRFGRGYAFERLQGAEVRRVAAAFSQAEKMVVWLPRPQDAMLSTANVILQPGVGWGQPQPEGSSRLPPHFVVIDLDPAVPDGRSWGLELTPGDDDYRKMIQEDTQGSFREVETLEVQKTRGYFADQWDPQPGGHTPSGSKAKSYFLRRFVLRWVAGGTEFELHYGDEGTTRDEARRLLMKLAASLRPVTPNEKLAVELRALIATVPKHR